MVGVFMRLWDAEVPMASLKTVRHSTPGEPGWHTLVVSPDGEFCGETHCDGTCGFSALVLPVRSSETGSLNDLKAHSSNVAVGHVWQRLTSRWKGSIHRLPEADDRSPELSRMWW